MAYIDISVGFLADLPAKIPDPWLAAPDPGALDCGSCGLEVLSGVRIRGPGPWAAFSRLFQGTVMGFKPRHLGTIWAP